ncbi:hypothetical protein CEXT_23481 [Caerostris extrusa]|uniref:Uncharacterized protein n=1 Tax=Caerostris extrusa TaxID=172846 RepID=A0AAV4P6Y9_CAEEX|nr:hypothetical protein CEXT_23481 [Caerostris extrusa]
MPPNPESLIYDNRQLLKRISSRPCSRKSSWERGACARLPPRSFVGGSPKPKSRPGDVNGDRIRWFLHMILQAEAPREMQIE